MAEDDLQALRTSYEALKNQLALFEAFAAERKDVVDGVTFRRLADEVGRIASRIPGRLPPFDEGLFFSHDDRGLRYYKVSAIRSYLGAAVERLAPLVGAGESAQTIQLREFPFVRDAELRRVLERDCEEIERAYGARCWKSVIILSGGVIEAILAELLSRQADRAKAAKSAPDEPEVRPDIGRWPLFNLIDVAVELGVVSSGVQRLSHSVRAYRNVVHPMYEVREKLKFDEEEAAIARRVLDIVCREVST